MNGEIFTTAHVWIGMFDNEEDYFDYADSIFDLHGEEALDCVFFEKTYSALDILNVFGLELADTFDKYMTMQANAAICLYDHDEWKERFEKIAKKAKRLSYLGEFYIAEPEDIVNEGRYDAEI